MCDVRLSMQERSVWMWNSIVPSEIHRCFIDLARAYNSTRGQQQREAIVKP